MSPVAASTAATTDERIVKLLGEADKALNEEFPPKIETAFNCFQNALAIDENNVSALDGLGELLANLGDSVRAVEVLMRSAQVAPNEGASKYFYLGQMLNGSQALEAYTKCIQVASSEAAGVRDAQVLAEIRSRMVSVYCAIGELYMTDLCDEVTAEEGCQDAFRKALEMSPDSIEALNGMATFNRIRLEIEDSKSLCLKAFEIIAAVLQDTSESDDLELLAPFPLRQRLAQNLVELELVDEALAILSTLLEEDEEDLQSWFMTGCCHLVSKEKGEARECVKQGKRLLRKNRQQMDPRAVEHWTKSFEELESRIAALNTQSDDNRTD